MKIFDNHKLIIAFVCIPIILMILWRTFVADCQDNTALHLAQCLRAECGDCDRYPEERAAIAHVLQKRADILGWSTDRMIREYCSVFRASNPRARAIRRSTFERPLEGGLAWWRGMQAWTAKFLDGEISDPQPASRHFGGPADHYRARKANWLLLAKYSNWFYSF